MHDRACRAWKAWGPYLLIAGLCIIFFGDSLFAGKALVLRDVWGGWLSGRALQKRAIWSGHWPIWDPCEGCGQLLLGNSSSGVLYLPHLIFDVLPIVTALKLSQVFHLFIAISGMYRLLRSWNCRPAAALIGAIASGMGTCWIAYMEWPYAIGVLAWTGWAMLFAGELADRAAAGAWKRSTGKCVMGLIDIRSTFTAIAKLTIVLALQFLGGHPDVWYFCTLLLLLYALIEFPARIGWLSALRAWQGLAIAMVFAAMIASPEWLMLAQRVALSVRAASFDPLMSQASVHPAHWMTLLLPYLFGRAGYPDRYWGITMFEFWAGTSYVGILPLGLAITALIGGWRGANRLSRARLAFLTTILLLGIVLASGQYTPMYLFIHNHLPGMGKMRWPSKALILVHFALAMLAGVGAERLFKSRETRERSLIGWIVSSAFVVATIACAIAIASSGSTLFQHLTLNHTTPTPKMLDDFHGQLIGALIVLIASSLTLIGLMVRRLPIYLFAWALVAICYFDLFHISRQVHPIGPDTIYQMSDSLPDQMLGAHSPLDRIASNYAGLGQMLYADPNPADFEALKPLAVGDTWLRYDVSNFWASGLVLDRYAQLVSTLGYVDDASANRLADVMSITRLIGWRPRPEFWNGQPAGAAHVWPRPTAMPRASLVRNWIIPKDLQFGATMLFSPQFDLGFTALLEPDSAGDLPPSPDMSLSATHTAVKNIQYDWDRCDIELETNGRALLVLNDIFYPGWHATVDGEPARIYCANLLFRGVIVNKGSTHVTFTYGPWQFRFGMTLSFCTVVGLIAGSFFWRQKKETVVVEIQKAPIVPPAPPPPSQPPQPIAIPIPPVRRRPQ